ncbi:MAG: hypothetical protein IPJ47_10055 [Anaerolineales bacterium]|nr:hypothetical protein [Anaerolineales bacterium]
MTETNVLPWVEVNEMMDDEYRQLVVAEALGHYPKASPELNKFALDILKKTIQVNGFRSFQSIPPHMAKIQVVKEFKVNDLVAAAVICLWAEKQHELIESLAKAAREANIPVPETGAGSRRAMALCRVKIRPSSINWLRTCPRRRPSPNPIIIFWLHCG